MSHFGQWIKSGILFNKQREQGQVMVLALIALALGALTITPTLNYMTTGVKTTSLQQNLTQELYAADAGVEYAMWCIQCGTTCPASITVGGKTVSLTVSSVTELPYGPVVSGSGVHVDWMHVNSETLDNGDTTYTCTISITNSGGSGTPPIKLNVIGAGMPDGFTYLGPCSGVTANAPVQNGSKLSWSLGTPKPEVRYGETSTQTFLIRGSGTPRGSYAWVEASREDVGTVSSCVGYTVISQTEKVTIESQVINNQGNVFPNTWKVT